MKKIALFLALLLVICVAYAETSITGNTVKIAAGGSGTLDLSVSATDGWAGILVEAGYDTEALTLTGITPGTVAGENTSVNPDTAKAAAAFAADQTTTGNLFSWSFTAKSGVVYDEKDVTFTVASATNAALSTITPSVTNGKVIIYTPNSLYVSDSASAKTTYIEGQHFESTGLEVRFVDADGNNAVIDNSNLTFPTEALTLSDTAVTIEYTVGESTYQTSLPITVNAKQLQSISATGASTYKAFEKVNCTVSATFDNGVTTEITDYTVIYPNGKDSLRVSDTFVTFRYTYGGVTKDYEHAVTVSKADPTVNVTYNQNKGVYTSTTVSTMPALSLSSDSTPGEVAWDTFTTPLTAGDKEFAWTYTPTDADNYNGKTGSFTITVQDVELVSITASANQVGKTIYASATLDDIKNMVVAEAHYNNGTSENISDSIELSGEIKAGTCTITATYSGMTTTFEIDVTAVVATGIDVQLTQGSTDVYETDDKEKIRSLITSAIAQYNDGSTKDIKSELAITGNFESGKQTFTLSWGEFSKKVEITITPVSVASMTAVYTQGDTIICEGSSTEILKKNLKVNVKFNNGATKSDYTGYTLSGTLKVGTSTVTVKADNATTTFTVKVSAHNWNEGEITKWPTSKVKGEKTYTCQNCRTTKIEEIPIPTAVVLAEKAVTLGAGQTYQIVPTVEPATSATKFTYKSSSAKVATVDTNGKVTAIKAGKAKITVKTETGKSATCTVTVLAAPTAVELVTESSVIGINEKISYTINVTPAKVLASGTLTVTEGSDVIAVDETAQTITALKVGRAKLLYTSYNGLKSSAQITVTDAPTAINVESTTAKIALKGTMKLSYTVTPAVYTGNVSVVSSEPTIVAVAADGTLTAKKIGTAVITLSTYNGAKAKVTVTVVKAPTKVTLDAKKATVGVGDEWQLAATVLPADTVGTITWASSKTTVATVDQNGHVKAVGAGTAKITATTYNKKKATFTLTVQNRPTKITLTAGQTTLIEGKSTKLTSACTPKKTTVLYTIESSDPNVVAIDGTNLVAKSAGTAKITAKTTYGAQVASDTLTIEVKKCATSVSVASTTITLNPKQTASFGLIYKEGETDEPTFTSAKKSIATVAADGTITAKKKGTTTITAKFTKAPSVTVTVEVVAATSKEAPVTEVPAEETPVVEAPEEEPQETVEAVKPMPVAVTIAGEDVLTMECDFAEFDEDGKILYAEDWDGKGEMLLTNDKGTVKFTFKDYAVVKISATAEAAVKLDCMGWESEDNSVVKEKDGTLRIRESGETEIELNDTVIKVVAEFAKEAEVKAEVKAEAEQAVEAEPVETTEEAVPEE